MDAHTRAARVQTRPSPQEYVVSAQQARRLANVTDVPAHEIAGTSIADLSKKFGVAIDPRLLFFERVCGKVVKTDPVSHIDRPVPFAKVHVYDVECSLFGYFPDDWPFSWFFPFFCRREELATATADACGNFCVWVPRFEIDWILTWRRERVCFPEIFRRPTIGDLVERVLPPVEKVKFPIPKPDPVPDLLSHGGMALQRLTDVLGVNNVEKLRSATAQRTIGANTGDLKTVFQARAYSNVAPPLPQHVHEVFQKEGAHGFARHAGLAAEHSERVDPRHLHVNRYFGPFGRCADIAVPEWLPIFDVPDIAFSVTQNVDGIEQTIYDDGFAVDWEGGDLSNIVLHASELAVATTSCRTPAVDCNQQGFRFVGLMPLLPAYHQPATGVAVRPNRPSTLLGVRTEPSFAPYTGTLQLYGCNHAPGASFYRVGYRFDGSADAFFTGVTWPIYPFPAGGPTAWVTPDPAGWYPILANPDDWFPAHLLFEWPTGQTGTYEMWLEYGDAGRAPIGTSDTVKIAVDNSPFVAQFTQLRWRSQGGVWSAPMELICPVIRRPLFNANRNIEIEVTYLASTTAMRDVALAGGGCGEGGPTPISDPQSVAHWYTGEFDNSHNSVATFALPGTVPGPMGVQISNQGAYSFVLTVNSRAFNPAGSDTGPLHDWRYDNVFRYGQSMLPIAIVDV